VPALKEALDRKPSLEFALRIRRLLEKQERGSLSGEELRSLRAVELLAHVWCSVRWTSGKPERERSISHYMTVGSSGGAVGGRTSLIPSAFRTWRARGFAALTPLRVLPSMVKRT
jgi:hypothetical protein